MHEHVIRHVAQKVIKPVVGLVVKTLKDEIVTRKAADPTLSVGQIVKETATTIGSAAVKTVKLEDSSLVISAKPLADVVKGLGAPTPLTSAIAVAKERQVTIAELLGLPLDQVREMIASDVRIILAESLRKSINGEEVKEAFLSSTSLEWTKDTSVTQLSDIVHQLSSHIDPRAHELASIYASTYVRIAKKFAAVSEAEGGTPNPYPEKLEHLMSVQLGQKP